MIGWLRGLIRHRPTFSEARQADASAMAALHAQSFHRGWSDGEFAALLDEFNVLAHCAKARGSLVGFVISRAAADEAEILSVAVSERHRGRGIAGMLLELHLRRLAGTGCRTVFLEVEELNTAALRLYKTAGFAQVGRREGYYQDNSGVSAALVLRRDIA